MAVLCTHQDGPVSKMSCCTRGYAWLAKVLRLSMWSDHSNTPQVGVEPCGVTHSEHYAQLSTGVDRRQTPRGGGGGDLVHHQCRSVCLCTWLQCLVLLILLQLGAGLGRMGGESCGAPPRGKTSTGGAPVYVTTCSPCPFTTCM